MSPASPEPVPLPAPATTRGEKALLVALAGLVFLAPLVILRGNFDAANLPQSAFIALGALALLCLWLWRSSPVFRLPRLLILPPSLALLAWSALSLLWAANRYEGAVVLLHWSACALVGVLTAARVREPREARLVLLGLFGAGLSVALLGTLQHLTGFSAIPQGFPPAATFVNKNMAAQFVIMVLPVGLALALETPRLGALVFYWGSALMGAYVFYTRTRSAWLALAAEALLLVLFRRHLGQSTKGRGLALVGSLALLALLVHLGPLGFVRGPSAAYQDLVKPWLSSAPPAGAPPAATILSVQERIAIWRNTLAMIRDAPLLGVGLGNHPVQYPRYAHRVVVDPLFSPTLQLDYVHNDYLQVGAELGLVGLLLSLWFGIALVRTFRSSEAAAPPGWTGLGLGLFVGIAGVLVDALFSFPFYRAVPPLVIMVAVGLAAGVGRPSERTLILSPGLSRLLLGL
ncbi:MAG TPA: O-antigen ligase family protein, partial [Vicinamibacteria bacterium]|nr:O-antigen ligase family protein [Vicinamibacteria bacterium]